MVYSKHNCSYDYDIRDFLQKKHNGICTKNGLRDYLFSIGWLRYPSIFFHVDTQYEEVSKDDKGYDPEHPFRLKSMQICLSLDEEYYSWEDTEKIDPSFRKGLISYFEEKGYPIGEFIQEGGGSDAEKIDQFFQAMLRDKFKAYGFKLVEANT